MPKDPQIETKPATTGFDAERFFRRMGSIGHGQALAMEWRRQGADWVELALPWRADLVGDEEAGLMASGPIFAMMDNATSLATWRRMGAFRPSATLDFRIDYIRPAKSGRAVIGRGECYQVTRSIAFVRGIAYEEKSDDPIAHVAGTFMFTGPVWRG